MNFYFHKRDPLKIPLKIIKRKKMLGNTIWVGQDQYGTLTEDIWGNFVILDRSPIKNYEQAQKTP
jgi:hypothetical protein